VRLLRVIALAIATRTIVVAATAAVVYVAVPLVLPRFAVTRSVQDTVTDLRSGLTELGRVLESTGRR
jgi:uncharacterized membrane protein YjjP (DUF1212 family)